MIDAPLIDDPDPIEVYLDGLLARLRGTAGDVRRALAESESHLRDAVDDAVARGVLPERAVAEALTNFGGTREVARAFNRRNQPRAARVLLPGLVLEAWAMVVLGLAAVAVSAPVMWLLTQLFGVRTVFGGGPGVHYDPASCAHFLAVQPSAHGCVQAALFESRDDGYVQRIAAAILALILYGGLLAVRRHRRPPVGAPVPALLPSTVGVTVFGGASVALIGYGVDRAVLGYGQGQWLVGGSIALIVAAFYLLRLWRQLTGTSAVPG
ncbi:MAG TPA: permease prefix domain 1-containing protein [Mycobacteriales bacterium]|jgi:hypothetical protein|nr:permease prefix domain 1-containing protein [Mycobacteriales bacterium]